MTEVVKILNTWQVTISLALFSQKNLIKNIDLAYIFVFLITCMITFNVKFKLLLSKKRIFFCILLDIKYLINICVTPLQSKNNRIYNKMLQHWPDLKKKQLTTINLDFGIMNTTDMEVVPISSLKSISEKPRI